MGPAADIDRLIEEGLNRYGTGDLDGALLVWEQALAIDPDNAQASSYVDYVRLNYEVLHHDGGLGVITDSGAPFGIEAEPEYIIEISHGEIGPGEALHPPLYMDPTDEGWFIEEEQTRELHARTRSGGQVEILALPAKEIEIEADEPPELELAPPGPQRAPSADLNFDSATREYGSDARAPKPPQRETPNDFLEEPSSFRPEATPAGFSNLDTEIRKRDLGFVQPTQVPFEAAITAARLGAPTGRPRPEERSGGEPAQLEVRLRTPSASPPVQPAAPVEPSAAGDLERGDAGRGEPTTSQLGKTARGIPPVSRTPAPSHAPPLQTPVARTTSEDDLIKSLPSPRRMTPLRGSQPPPLLDPASRIPTRELPEKTRPPAASPTDRAETTQGGDDDDIALPSASTRDLGLRPIGENDFAVSAPTRDLGLRMPDVAGGAGRAEPVASKRPPSVFPDEDAPTRQSDARQFREEHSTQKLTAFKKDKDTGGASDGTRHDIVLPFDPIDARTAQVLEAIEPPGGEPGGETKEDRTRRRITALIERSTAWSVAGELDKAVAAVDLALSEDPDTALAQKLIHRNRDAIMSVFQLFLGDLERQPQLSRPLHELAAAPISPRAAFLLSRIDGTLTIDEVLDVSGMPRLEAYRHLCQLFLRGILR
ncbi:MAG: hypothetical protein ABI467_12995 [Kofleriaceae bacterium]